MRWADLHGRVVVWGLGREGRAVAQRCHELGLDVEVAVDGEPAPGAPAPQGPAGVPVHTGAAALAALRAADVVVKSPGIPVATGPYADLVAAGVAVTSLADLWLGDHHARALGVTGTKGKSTTTSVVAHLLRGLGEPAEVVGNIGRPVLEAPATGTCVVELSSYQCQSLTVSPRLAVVTSLFPEHLPWHGSQEAYFHDKLTLLAHGPEHVVLPHDDARLLDLALPRAGTATVHLTGPETILATPEGALVWPGGDLPASALPLRGVHNARNLALAVLSAAVWTGRPVGEVAPLLAGFAPLPHRLEVVPTGDGRTWVDDTLATAPEAVVAALGAYAGPVAAIVGGADRGLDMTPLADYVRSRPEVVLLAIGPAGARLAAEHPDLPVRVCAGLAAAVAHARSDLDTPVVLLSPGAPSFDEYADYEARSAAFRAMLAETPR